MPVRIDGSSSTTKTDLRVGTMLIYPGFNDLHHYALILAHRHKVFILSLRARSFENRTQLRNIDHLLESRLGSSMPSRSAFETSSASECTSIFSITWWRWAFTV